MSLAGGSRRSQGKGDLDAPKVRTRYKLVGGHGHSDAARRIGGQPPRSVAGADRGEPIGAGGRADGRGIVVLALAIPVDAVGSPQYDHYASLDHADGSLRILAGDIRVGLKRFESTLRIWFKV